MTDLSSRNAAAPPAPRLTLFDYWRSGAAYRTRIALNLKGLAYQRIPVDLRDGEQSAPAYLAVNGQGLVPTLEIDGRRLSQSPAILEWLEEVYPDPPLLPKAPLDRAIVRAMAAVIGCDIHPLNNLRVQQRLRGSLHASEAEVSAWIDRWIRAGFEGLEPLVATHGGLYAFGDRPTFADCYLAPQVYSAERFKVDLTDFPTLRRVVDQALQHPAFAAAHPDAVAP